MFIQQTSFLIYLYLISFVILQLCSSKVKIPKGVSLVYSMNQFLNLFVLLFRLIFFNCAALKWRFPKVLPSFNQSIVLQFYSFRFVVVHRENRLRLYFCVFFPFFFVVGMHSNNSYIQETSMYFETEIYQCNLNFDTCLLKCILLVVYVEKCFLYCTRLTWKLSWKLMLSLYGFYLRDLMVEYIQGTQLSDSKMCTPIFWYL